MTKEMKKHSSRPVGGAEMGSRGREDSQQGGGWQTKQGGRLWKKVGQARLQLADPATPHSRKDKTGGTVGNRSRPNNPGLQRREIKPQISD